ncbi:MAG: cytochrome c biogenesis protein ResB [Cyanobacteria bacterium J06623_1]
MFDRIVRFIGSIKLAVPLLSAIIGILIWATFYEAQVGSTTVQQEVYKSPWFGALMFMLAVNLGISAMSRYPWRGARKVGFALTHFGLIVIIAGSAAVIHLGMEGMLLVRTDRNAVDRLRVQGDLLEVVNNEGEVTQGSIFIRQDGSVSPKYLGGLELEAYTDHAVREITIAPGGTVDNPGVRISLASDRMGQTIERTLAVSPKVYSQMSLGPAELELVQVKSNEELNRLLKPKQGKGHPWGELALATGARQKLVDVKANRGKTLQVGKFKVLISDFYPDFRLNRDKQPATASEKLNNPAIALEVATDRGRESWYVFAKADFPPVRTLISGESIEDLQVNYQVQPVEVKDYFKIITQGDRLYYAAKSSTQFKSGTIAPGETVTPGWADFQITLAEYLPRTQIQRKILPAIDDQVQGAPALLVKTKSGQETWLPWGEASAIRDGDREIYAAFSPKMLQIPFGVKLEDFIVDRNEGSESVAMWTSKIRIEDGQNNNVEQRKVWMNHPTWYKGWKIAQASWNPGDLQQSTLQVKREPAWVTALTWIGSALVILGIAVMFYAPALSRKLGSSKEKIAVATESAAESTSEGDRHESQEPELTTVV